MNNKRAKYLRKLAEEITLNADIPVENIYTDNHYKKSVINNRGKCIEYTVYTRKLDQCERAVYQRLKEEMK